MTDELCTARGPSVAVPGHTHTCVGRHSSSADHYCGECQRWWWVK